MRNVNELSHEQLVEIVESIRAHLYLDTNSEGRQFWNPDRSWSGADVCEEAARLLDRHGLVPELETLVDLSEMITRPLPERPATEIEPALLPAEHPPIGSDSSGDSLSLCECEEPGHLHCGVPGILAHLEQGRLEPGGKVERCDLCQRYPSDEAALEKLRELGIADQQPRQQFNVHLYPVVRVTVPSVHAISQQEAISKALASIDLYAWVCNSKVEYAEELAYYAVDVVGDEEFRQTRWYNCRETSQLAHLTRLVQWHDSGRPEDELQQIIDEARDVLANSI